MKPSPIPEPEADFMNVDETDFSTMSRAEQIRRFEVEGYVVFPRSSPACCRSLEGGTRHCGDVAYELQHAADPLGRATAMDQSPAAAELISYPPMIDFLTDLMGPEIVFTRGFLQRSLPRCPGISMHTDGQPHSCSFLLIHPKYPAVIDIAHASLVDHLFP